MNFPAAGAKVVVQLDMRALIDCSSSFARGPSCAPRPLAPTLALQYIGFMRFHTPIILLLIATLTAVSQRVFFECLTAVQFVAVFIQRVKNVLFLAVLDFIFVQFFGFE
jgi:hypothetical protein